MTNKQKRWLVIVNALTLSRIVGAIVLFPIYYHYGKITIGVILTILFLTDWVDGYLARKFHVSTFFGSIADSVCDKVMAIATAILLCFINKYMIACVVLELLIFLVNTFILTQKGNIKSSYIGKCKMWVLSICTILGFFFSKSSNNKLNLIIAAPAIIAQFITLIDYLLKMKNVHVHFDAKKPKYKSGKEIGHMLFDPKFYDENKNKTGLIDNIYKNEK